MSEGGFRNLLKFKKNIFQFVIVICIIYACYLLLNNYNTLQYSKNVEWDQYKSINSVRAAFNDYGMPDYSVYESEYSRLNISANDYKFWFGIGMRGDQSRINNSLYEELVQIRDENDYVDILKLMKDITRYLFSQSYFYIMLCITLAFFNKNSIYRFCGVLCSIITVYIILSVRGRIQHHVDVVLFLSCAILLLIYVDKEAFKQSRLLPIVMIIPLVILFNDYNKLTKSSYMGNDIESIGVLCEQNYEKLAPFANDKEHVYVIHPRYTEKLFMCYTPFKIIPKAFYSNIWNPSMSHIEYQNRCLHTRNVENVWDEATDSDIIRFICNKEMSFEIEIVEKYVKENYNVNAYADIIYDSDVVVYVIKTKQGGV